MSAVPQTTPVSVTDKPNIFIAGPSGSGKSTSLRNLDPARTVVINTEQKTLPFKAAKKFTKTIACANLEQFRAAFARALTADADYIVVDSFTSLTEFMYRAVVRHVEKSGDNVMAAWAQYKDKLHDILLEAKTCNKYVIFTGIDDVVQDDKMSSNKAKSPMEMFDELYIENDLAAVIRGIENYYNED